MYNIYIYFTFNLSPVQVNIQEDGWVCLEFIKNRRSNEQQQIHEVCKDYRIHYSQITSILCISLLCTNVLIYKVI